MACNSGMSGIGNNWWWIILLVILFGMNGGCGCESCGC